MDLELPAILLATIWLLPFVAVLRLLPRTPDLSHAPRSGGRKVSVIVPARNESGAIGTLLGSLLASRYDPFEVLVVDDRSTDDTALLVEEFVRTDVRIRLIRGAELPAGWYGKPWACYQGYREARGDLLLFTDADTRHEPDLLAHAVGALDSERADLVSALSLQRCITFWERVIMPQIFILLALRFYPRRVNRAKHARDVIANGQFILVRRDSYEKMGTHEIVRDQIAEDLALAQEFWRKGARLHLAHAETLIETRMYTSLKTLVEGWSKNIYLGGKASFPDDPFLGLIAPVGLITLMLFWLLPVAWLLLAAMGMVSGFGSAIIGVMFSALFWAVMCTGMRIPPWYALTWPLGAGMTCYIICRSMWRGSRAVQWKGRVYSGVEGSRALT